MHSWCDFLSFPLPVPAVKWSFFLAWARACVCVFILGVVVLVMLVAVYYVLNTECYKNVFDLRNKNDCLQKPGVNAWALVEKEAEE